MLGRSLLAFADKHRLFVFGDALWRYDPARKVSVLVFPLPPSSPPFTNYSSSTMTRAKVRHEAITRT